MCEEPLRRAPGSGSVHGPLAAGGSTRAEADGRERGGVGATSPPTLLSGRDANQLAADVRAGLNTVDMGFHVSKAKAKAALDELVGLVGTLHAQGYDEGQNDVWSSLVCSVCGQNHDRDESAMCDDGEVVSLGEFVQSVGALVGTLQQERDEALGKWSDSLAGERNAEQWMREAKARAEALQQERDDLAVGYKARGQIIDALEEQASEAVLAAEAALAEMTAWRDEAEGLYRATAEHLRHAQGEVATTRQALTDIAESGPRPRQFRSDLEYVIYLQGIARRALADTGGDTARYGCVADCRADAGAGLHSPDCRVPPAGGDTKEPA